MRTKWDILVARRDAIQADLQKVEQELRWLENTSLGTSCAGCGEVLKTEADFAKHFLVADEHFLNLGECPKLPNVYCTECHKEWHWSEWNKDDAQAPVCSNGHVGRWQWIGS